MKTEIAEFIERYKGNPGMADYVLDAEESLLLLEQSLTQQKNHELEMIKIRKNNEELEGLVEELKVLCTAKGT
ncbi:MAG: hypothetical protein QGG64_20450 [Candidatus Latescibacteria bacterium]|nr:hypothetical protein [Candidatus Latescibacterota bacterium]